MKKFSQINYNDVDNKKYKEKSKNDIYSLIKENINIHISPLNEKTTNLDNININLDGTDKLVNDINCYIEKKILEEKIKVLESIKSSIATGTLNLQKINEEIVACTCSETCPTAEEDEIEDDYIINDYNEVTDEYTEFVDTNEGKKINLVDKFITLLDEGKVENMTWDNFFDMYNIKEKYRTNYIAESVMKKVKEKRKL